MRPTITGLIPCDLSQPVQQFCGRRRIQQARAGRIEHDLAPLLTGPATALAGPVIVHTLA